MFKGKVHWYKNGEADGSFPNAFVYDGREAVMDWMFGLEDWRGQYVGTGVDVYVAVGTSTDTNDGVRGPAPGYSPGTGLEWQLVDLEDSRLSNELGRTPGVFTRTNQTVEIRATFTDAELGTGAVDIREMGVFLGSSAPAGDPSTYLADRPKAMLTRSVRYSENTGYYIDNPLEREAGDDITIRYEFGAEVS